MRVLDPWVGSEAMDPARPDPSASLVVYVNKLVGLLLLAVKAYVFFVTGLLFGVGVDILSELSLPIHVSMLCELNIIAEKC